MQAYFQNVFPCTCCSLVLPKFPMRQVWLLTMANTPFSGDFGKLGHGNSQTQKVPKLVEGLLVNKVRLRTKVCFISTLLLFS